MLIFLFPPVQGICSTSFVLISWLGGVILSQNHGLILKFCVLHWFQYTDSICFVTKPIRLSNHILVYHSSSCGIPKHWIFFVLLCPLIVRWIDVARLIIYFIEYDRMLTTRWNHNINYRLIDFFPRKALTQLKFWSIPLSPLNEVLLCSCDQSDVNTVTFADETGHLIYSGSDDNFCKVLIRILLLPLDSASKMAIIVLVLRFLFLSLRPQNGNPCSVLNITTPLNMVDQISLQKGAKKG